SRAACSVHSALSSVVHERSGRRSGLLLIAWPSVLTPPWYSSDTVGKRIARPVDAFSTLPSPHCQASAAFGETKLCPRSGCAMVHRWAEASQLFCVVLP